MRLTRDYASPSQRRIRLVEEERHVVGIRVDEVIIVDLGEQGCDHRGALGLGELATPELARFRGLGDLCAHTLTIRARRCQKWMGERARLYLRQNDAHVLAFAQLLGDGCKGDAHRVMRVDRGRDVNRHEDRSRCLVELERL